MFVYLYCSHGEIFKTSQARTKYAITDKYRPSTISYAINTYLVMSLQLFGSGGTEVQHLLAFLGLPNGATFGKKSFHQIEESLGHHIRRITDDMVTQALQDEVEEQLKKKIERVSLNHGKRKETVKCARKMEMQPSALEILNLMTSKF